MLFRFLFLMLVLFFAQKSVAQVAADSTEKQFVNQEIKILEDTLVILGFAMVNDSSEINRFASCKKFIQLLVKALQVKNSFDFPFHRLRTVSILYPPDSTFRIFTWQVYDDINHYHYYGTLQMNQEDLVMYPLIDRSAQLTDLENLELDPANWYGQLYYNIHPFESKSGKAYLMFGYDAYQFFNKRKILEVLHFREGKPVFGMPVFETENGAEKDLSHRLLFEYSADAKFKMNFDANQNMVLLDHLVQMGSPYPGQESTFVPDGDIDGFFFEDGIWKFKARVFDQILDEAPRPQPVFTDKKKDLFGKE